MFASPVSVSPKLSLPVRFSIAVRRVAAGGARGRAGGEVDLDGTRRVVVERAIEARTAVQRVGAATTAQQVVAAPALQHVD